MKQILPYCSTWLQILSSSPSLLCCAGLHLPLLQFVVGWPWTWNNPLASVSQTLWLQFMCHWTWLSGLILESGPVHYTQVYFLSTTQWYKHDQNCCPRDSCEKPLLLLCLLSTRLRSVPIHMPLPLQFPNLKSAWTNAFFLYTLHVVSPYSRLSWVPDHPRRLHAGCLEPSSAQCWLHPHTSDCNSSVFSFQSHIFSPGQERDNTQPHENFGCLWICLTKEMSVVW